MRLLNPQPPRLPDPDQGYSVGYFNQLLRTLRLYFNQLSNAISSLLGPLGGTSLQTAYAEYVSTVSQTIASTTTAYVVTFNTTVFEAGITLVSSSRLTVPVEGIYQIAVNLQLANNDIALQTVGVWFRVNGVDEVNSRARFSVTERHGGLPGHSPAELVHYFSLNAGDYVEIVWFATDTDVSLEYLAPDTSPTRPAAPSATATMAFVSALTTA